MFLEDLVILYHSFYCSLSTGGMNQFDGIKKEAKEDKKQSDRKSEGTYFSKLLVF